MNTEVLTHSPMQPGEETSIASSIIPYPWDDNRALFLSFRACGLSIREALNSCGVSISALKKWRKDCVFLDYEHKLPEVRQELARTYINIEFLRNMRMVLERDKNILAKALRVDTGVPGPDGEEIYLTKQEQQYLLSLRRNYTPQQLEILDTLVTIGPGRSGGGGESWVEAITEIARKNRANVELSRTDTVRFNNATAKEHNEGQAGSSEEHSESPLISDSYSRA